MKKLLLACMMALGIGVSAQIDLGSGTSTTSSSVPVPWSDYYGYSYTQQILKRSEINANAAGSVTGLKFYLGSTQTLSGSNNITVYVGHTAKTLFTSTTDWVPASEMTQVFSGTVTNSAGVVTVTFATPFAYNNADNLVIAIDENAASYDTSATTEYFYKYNGATASTLYYLSDTVNPDPTNITQQGTLSSYHSRMTLLGLTLSSTTTCPIVYAPATAATGQAINPTISWNAVSGATSYVLNIGTTPGGTDIVNNLSQTATTYTIPTASPLLYNTTYYYSVNAVGPGGTSMNCTPGSFTTKNLDCPTVTAPAVAATEQSLTPTFTWTANSAATGYRISIGTTSGGTDIANNIDLGNVTSYTLPTTLSGSTRYYYTINAYNAQSTSQSCTVRNFVTVCGPKTANYSENFDTTPVGSSTAPSAPNCWQYVETASNAGYGYTTTSGNSTPNSFYLTNASASSGNVMLVSPKTTNLSDGTRRVKFFAKGGSGYTLQVGTLSDPTNPASFTSLSTLTLTSTWTQYTVNIPAGTNLYLAFRHGMSSTYQSIYIDDISIENLPSCGDVAAPTVTNIGSDSANVNWVASSPTPASYDMYYSTTNTPPTAATTPSQSGIVGTSTTISNLSSSTTYYVWVRSHCSATEFGEWSFSTTFATQCPATSLPWAENFDAMATVGTSTTSVLPTCWTTVAGGSSNTYGFTVMDAASNTYNDPQSPTKYMTVYYPYTNSAYVFTPGFNLTANTSYTFTFSWVGDGKAGWQVDAIVNAGPTVTGATTLGNIVTSSTTTTATYTTKSFTFTPTVTGMYNFGIKALATTSSPFYMGFDDFSVSTTTLGTTEVATAKASEKVYPNPFTDFVDISDVKGAVSAMVVDASGKMVASFAKADSRLDLSKLNAGLYILSVTKKDGSVSTFKIIKK